MRWRPCAAKAAPRAKTEPHTPPLPENPYRRFFTPTPTFEDLVRKSREKPPAERVPETDF